MKNQPVKAQVPWLLAYQLSPVLNILHHAHQWCFCNPHSWGVNILWGKEAKRAIWNFLEVATDWATSSADRCTSSIPPRFSNVDKMHGLPSLLPKQASFLKIPFRISSYVFFSLTSFLIFSHFHVQFHCLFLRLYHPQPASSVSFLFPEPLKEEKASEFVTGSANRVRDSGLRAGN